MTDLTELRAIFVYEGARLAAIAAKAPIIPEIWQERDEAFQTQFFEPCLYLRMRGRNPHFRIIYLRHEWKWKGDTAMVVK